MRNIVAKSCSYLVMFLSLSSASLLAEPNIVSNDSSIGKVIVTKNIVEANRKNALLRLKRKSPLYIQDLIQTGQDARARFRLADGTLFTLGENANFKIDEYIYPAANDAEPSAAFTLIEGTFRAITGKITHIKNPKFKVKTPLGTIGIRGTDFWGGYLEPDKIDVFLVSGEHSVIIENEFGVVELKNAGEGTTIAQGKAPTPPKKWPKAKVNKALATVVLKE